MTKITKSLGFKLLPLAVAVTAGNASALQMSIGPVDTTVSTSISYGVAIRTEDPDPSVIARHGTSELVPNASGSTYNFDDGNLNYEKGDIYTNVLKANADLEFNYDNKAGAFFRAKAYYDSAIMDGDPAWKEYTDATKDAAGQGYDLLDAYLWYNFDIGSVPVSARIGRQVISWGESTFIQGGINSINPIDASAARKPGVEVKEVLLPVNLAYASFGLTYELTLEAFYQLEWEKTRIDPCGTFFSTADFVADGCGPVVLGGPAGEKAYLNVRDIELASGAPLGDRSAPIAERMPDADPSDNGQYGIALRWYSEALGDTEFGFYHMNIHSRVPLISGKAANPYTDTDNDGVDDSVTNTNNPAAAFPSYQIQFPEDIKLSGISFNTTTAGGWSLGGEVSLTQDRPVQHNSLELLLAGNLVPSSKMFKQRYDEATGGDLDVNNPAEVAAAKAALAGNAFNGYDLYDIAQAQMTFVKFYDQVMGASRLTFATEIGMTHVLDLRSKDEARYGRSGVYGVGSFDPIAVGNGAFYTCDANDISAGPTTAGSTDGTNGTNGAGGSNENPANCTNDGYVDETSGGIRVRASLDYNNAFFGANLRPKIALGYDMNNGPEPGSQFVDGRIQASLGLDFVYLNRYSGGIAYSMFDGGDYNVTSDRDNVSLNLKVTF
ncbi:DUF1302 domain-containing protein [Bermanella marisrubri]|uniref:ABC-type dipeptide transport system, periplasmic component n=1 Tax=Bermanella marisrubri TaxID=207949 RepID=Q1N115_9GAMM|nr:DUF1302 domain-containing protein [Bermanella marisrubri]EAT11859.1 ABC-type dipeptide transport system, periplasmic component [Oceanobacter sp. RED65] [Bermanella marisrubri]QIZ83061.1 DUF1302 domain-containing protein [Bermanella marisrubri]